MGGDEIRGKPLISEAIRMHSWMPWGTEWIRWLTAAWTAVDEGNSGSNGENGFLKTKGKRQALKDTSSQSCLPSPSA